MQMNQEPEFKEFAKIYRFSRPCIITEKIDGTNGLVHITEDGQFFTGSRSRWITPEQDNYGFSKWAHEHKDELMTLGPGSHFGEWWGQGIQRNYGLKEKRWSMFNVSRWYLHGTEPKQFATPDPRVFKSQQVLPPCVGLVPVLWQGGFDDITALVSICLSDLKRDGSKAAPGFMKPEGIVIYHVQGNILLKKTLEKDDQSKFNPLPSVNRSSMRR